MIDYTIIVIESISYRFTVYYWPESIPSHCDWSNVATKRINAIYNLGFECDFNFQRFQCLQMSKLWLHVAINLIYKYTLNTRVICQFASDINRKNINKRSDKKRGNDYKKCRNKSVCVNNQNNEK